MENVLIGYLQLQLLWGRAWCGQMALSAGFVGGGQGVLEPALCPPGTLGHAMSFSFMNPLSLKQPGW